MFKHTLKYNLKILYKNKMLIFWTYLFPIILGAFFYLAFHDIEKNETFEPISIAVINNDDFKNNEVWKNTINILSKKDSDEQIFYTNYKTLEEARSELKQDKITGYLLLEDNKPKVVIKKNGTSETIFKSIVEEINSKNNLINEYVTIKINNMYQSGLDPMFKKDFQENIYKEALSILDIETNIKDVTSNTMSYTMIEYYTLIAMTCLYGGILGMVSINKNLANMGSIGKRISVSITPKRITILSSALAGYIAEIIGLSLLFIFTIFILKVDYGSNLPLIILLSLVGSLTGLSLGIFCASIFKTNENTKLGLIIAITMTGCFLSGMMGITMKYIIDKNVPIVNKLNPASLITDSFYSLYHYSSLDRYWGNIISLIIIAIILILLSIRSLRRQKYDSI